MRGVKHEDMKHEEDKAPSPDRYFPLILHVFMFHHGSSAFRPPAPHPRTPPHHTPGKPRPPSIAGRTRTPDTGAAADAATPSRPRPPREPPASPPGRSRPATAA